MTAAPRIAEEQLSFAGKGPPAEADQRELLIGGTSTAQCPVIQGRFGDLKQSLTNQWTVQER